MLMQNCGFILMTCYTSSTWKLLYWANQYAASKGQLVPIMTCLNCLQSVHHVVTMKLLWHQSSQMPAPQWKERCLSHKNPSNSTFAHINIMPLQIIQTWSKDLVQPTIILLKWCVILCLMYLFNAKFVGRTWAPLLKASDLQHYHMVVWPQEWSCGHGMWYNYHIPPMFG